MKVYKVKTYKHSQCIKISIGNECTITYDSNFNTLHTHPNFNQILHLFIDQANIVSKELIFSLSGNKLADTN